MQEPLNIEQQRKVRELFAAMESKQDIVDLLNYVQKVQWKNKQTDRTELVDSPAIKDVLTQEKKSKKAKPKKGYPKTDLRTLNFFSNPDFFGKTRKISIGKSELSLVMSKTPPRYHRYAEFKVAKRNGGERTIHAPSYKLKEILRTLNVIFQCIEQPNNHAFGFVKNRCVVDNAAKHVGSHYVYNIDLKDFFHSFDRNRVKLGFMFGEFGLKKEREPLAFFLASLCTHRFEEDGTVKYVLPQGAPTSPTITNILCKQLDRRLNGLAKRFGAKYSRYADDITFSSQQNIFNKEEFQKELVRIIEADQGLKINPKKTRLQKAGYSQSVTGLTVNEKVNVPRRYVKQLRMWLYYLERYGVEKAEPLFRNDYIKDKGHVKNQKTSMVNVIEGKLNYLKMVKGETDPTYKKLFERFQNLFPKKKKEAKQKLIKYSTEEVFKMFGLDLPVTEPKRDFDDLRHHNESPVNARKSFEPEDISEDDELVIHAFEMGSVIGMSEEDAKSSLQDYKRQCGLVDCDGHDPKKLVSLLKNFTENTAMKYSTHSWDFGNFKSYEHFMTELTNDWTKPQVSGKPETSIKKELYRLNHRLSAKIDTFFFRSGLVDPKNPSYKITWRNSDNHRLTIGWSSPELVEFCAKNPDVSPFTFPIPEHHKVTGLQLDYFRDVSNVFKRDIEFREEGNQLSTMLDLLWENVLGYNFVLERKGTDGLSFFTDVDWVKRSITRIFEQIRQRQSHPNVRVTVTKQKNAIELRIIHVNSECMKDPNHPKLSGETGDFAELKKSLKSICDWSVESKFPDGKYYRLSYLVPQEQSMEKFIREIDHCEGFTHVLRFYL